MGVIVIGAVIWPVHGRKRSFFLSEFEVLVVESKFV